MLELTPHQMADALRKCGGTVVCEGCPYGELGTAKCIQAMQKDAAAMIEGLGRILDRQARTIEAARAYIREKSK